MWCPYQFPYMVCKLCTGHLERRRGVPSVEYYSQDMPDVTLWQDIAYRSRCMSSSMTRVKHGSRLSTLLSFLCHFMPGSVYSICLYLSPSTTSLYYITVFVKAEIPCASTYQGASMAVGHFTVSSKACTPCVLGPHLASMDVGASPKGK